MLFSQKRSRCPDDDNSLDALDRALVIQIPFCCSFVVVAAISLVFVFVMVVFMAWQIGVETAV